MVAVQEGRAVISPYPGLPSLFFAHDAESIDTAGFWFYNFEYEREKERGLDSVEDLYSPFLLRFDLAKNSSATIVASTQHHHSSEAARLRELELQRRDRISRASPLEDPFAIALGHAADQARGVVTMAPLFAVNR